MRFSAILFFLLVPFLTDAEQLSVIKDSKLTDVLANFVLLAETPESSKMFARVFRVQEHGECDGTPETCPKSTMYIAVSEYGEYPEQKLYQLPEGYNWEFINWVSFPETEDPPSNLVLKIKSQKPSSDVNKSWWINETYTLKVNYQTGSWEKE